MVTARSFARPARLAACVRAESGAAGGVQRRRRLGVLDRAAPNVTAFDRRIDNGQLALASNDVDIADTTTVLNPPPTITNPPTTTTTTVPLPPVPTLVPEVPADLLQARAARPQQPEQQPADPAGAPSGARGAPARAPGDNKRVVDLADRSRLRLSCSRRRSRRRSCSRFQEASSWSTRARRGAERRRRASRSGPTSSARSPTRPW